jgi:hypothetical protein
MTMMGDENDDDVISVSAYFTKVNANPNPGKLTTQLLLKTVTEY